MAGAPQPLRSNHWVGCLLLALTLTVNHAASASDAAARAPLLSFLQFGGSGYQWMFWQAGNAQAELFMETQVEPHHIFWDISENRVYYALDRAVFRSHVDRGPAQPERVAPLPDGFGEVRVLWRERKTGRLRIATMLEIEQGNVLGTGRVRYRLPDGSTIAAMAIPTWGIPFVCTVLELSGDGKTWKVLTRRATKDLAGDTPGISVVDDLRHERGASNDRLLESYTCSSGQCRNDVPADLTKRASTDIGRDLDGDETSIWHLGKDLPSIMFGTAMGDQLHMTPPVLLIAPKMGSIQTLEIPNRKQLGLGVDHPLLLLLADETTGTRPIVVELATGNVRFQAGGWGATWVPRSRRTKDSRRHQR